MPKKNYYKQREDNMKILIAAAKTRNNLTNEGLAKKLIIAFILGYAKIQHTDS